MKANTYLLPATKGKTFQIKTEILNHVLNTEDAVYVVESKLIGSYNEYGFLINKLKGTLIVPALGIDKDLNNKFLCYEVMAQKDGKSFADNFVAALDDIFRRVLINYTEGIKTHVYLDEIGMYYNKPQALTHIVNFVNDCKLFNCEVTLAFEGLEKIQAIFSNAM